MAKDDAESINKVLRELEKNKFVKRYMEQQRELSKAHMRTTIIIVGTILVTMLLLNWGGKLSMESNGWLLAALMGYLFGRGIQK